MGRDELRCRRRDEMGWMGRDGMTEARWRASLRRGVSCTKIMVWSASKSKSL